MPRLVEVRGYLSETHPTQKIRDICHTYRNFLHPFPLIDILADSETHILDAIHHSLETDGEIDWLEKHMQRVGRITEKFAQTYGLEPEDCKILGLAGTHHDVGKIAVDNSLINKPGDLTFREIRAMMQHPKIGVLILSFLAKKASPEKMTTLNLFSEAMLFHHAWFDGTGYPKGLSGENIPLAARVIAIVDSWDALTNDRPYHQAVNSAKAREKLLEGRGPQFDPKLFDLFLNFVTKNGQEVI